LTQEQRASSNDKDYFAEELEGKYALSETRGANEQVEFHPIWQRGNVYLCPRGISMHNGTRLRVGAAFAN
jgi:hypothetical protein